MTVEALVRGHSYLPRRAAALLARADAAAPGRDALSTRERTAIEPARQRVHRQEAAKRMFVSPKRSRGVCRPAQAGLTGSTDIVRFALKTGGCAARPAGRRKPCGDFPVLGIEGFSRQQSGSFPLTSAGGTSHLYPKRRNGGPVGCHCEGNQSRFGVVGGRYP